MNGNEYRARGHFGRGGGCGDDDNCLIGTFVRLGMGGGFIGLLAAFNCAGTAKLRMVGGGAGGGTPGGKAGGG